MRKPFQPPIEGTAPALSRRAAMAWLAGLAATAAWPTRRPLAQATANGFTDSAGRNVTLPATVSRVLAAGPPASVLLYTLAPQAMLGWVREPLAEEKPYLAAPYRDLPTHGRLTGRGNTASLETVVGLKPDLILDVGDVDATYASLADRVQAQTGIPYVLLDGAFAKTAQTYRLLGRILDRVAPAEELARYADDTLVDLASRVRAVPIDRKPRVYYGRGPQGLETGLAGSINLEVLDALGAANVAATAGQGGLVTVSPEQVLAWNPDVILTLDARFYADVVRNPLWSGIKAVRDRRVYRAPTMPFGWFDSPPGVNRLIGVRWLASVLYPDIARNDLGGVTRDFYRRFYHVDLTETQLASLLRDATQPPS